MTGEALISCLTLGRPCVVQRAHILPPQIRGYIDELTRRGIINNSLGEKYDTVIDQESAYDITQAKALKEQERMQKSRS